MTVTNTVAPALSGLAKQGSTLTTTNGTWTFDQDYLTYEYQWLRCDAAGANCVDIGGATAASYLLTGSDVGSRIRSEVTATEHIYDPPPTGTLRDAYPGQLLSVLNASSPGDTVRLRGGQHPYTVLTKSFAEPRVTVICESGSSIIGIDTNSCDGYIFDDCTFQRPPQTGDINNTVFYLHNTSSRIRIEDSLLSGGGITLKCYCPTPNFVTDFEMVDCEITAGAIDLSHWNGIDTFTLDHNYFHDPTFVSGAHQDAMQMTRARNFTVSRNIITAPGISGGNSQGMMIGSTVQGGESRSILNGVFVNNLVHHWNENKPLLITCADNVLVVNNTFQDHGTSFNSITITSAHGPVSDIEIWNNIVIRTLVTSGVTHNDNNWFTFGAGNGTNIHTGDPDFVNTTTYELEPGSPARGFGTVRTGTPTVDLDGNARSLTAPVVLGCRV